MSAPKRIKHGTISVYCNQRCRCELCRAAWGAYSRELRDRHRANGFSGLEHGKSSTYLSGCRCGPCGMAMAQTTEERARRRTAEGTVPHGTRYGYNAFKCRCEPCKAAASAYMAERRRRAVA
jgi:hypothetical protein